MSPKSRKADGHAHINSAAYLIRDYIKKYKYVEFSYEILFVIISGVRYLSLNTFAILMTVDNLAFYVRHNARELCGVQRPRRPDC